ncbi:hypothetical protein V501_05233, partial [Pseudogymnoascus sp. VKM F-4519 (FW-2642)]
SRKNVLPGSLIFATFGALGQAAYNYADAREGRKVSDKGEGKEGGWLNSRWSPVKALSDEEYERILEERLLRLDAEIALVDESIEAVKRGAVAAKTEGKTEGKK